MDGQHFSRRGLACCGFALLGIAVCAPTLRAAAIAGAPQPAPVSDAAPKMTGSSPLSLSLVDAADSSAPGDKGDKQISEIGTMDLESLMNVEISTGTLTHTERHLVPAAITSIDRAMIDQANPRSLYELLDIYVPDVRWAYHQWEMPHIGIRGIISDREDKYLMLVNGRVMNERSSRGVLSERDLVLLGDLQQVDMIRGPGSAVYGPGAIAGVINLQTYNGLNYQGTSITGRGGVYEEFYSVEAKHGERTGPNSGWFVYGGVAKYNGADRAYSPFVQGLDFTDSAGNQQQSGHPLDYQFTDLHAAYASNPQLKFFTQFDSDGLTLWARYTNGGQKGTIADRGWQAPWPYGWVNPDPAAQVGIGYQQLTAFAGYKHPITDTLSLDLSTSADFIEYERQVPIAPTGVWDRGYTNSHGEVKSITKALLHWDPMKNMQFAGGVEYQHMWAGLPSWRTPSLGGYNDRFPNADMPRWETNMISLVAEHQWNITDQWTTFLSGRLDKHSFTGVLFSPRAAIAYSPTDKDTIKAIASKSLRTNTEEEMKLQHDNDGSDSDPEIMRTYELRYERQHNPNLFFGASVFYNDLDVLGWDNNSKANKHLGRYSMLGGEGEIGYRTGDTSITLSHSIVKLMDFETEAGVSTSLSAKPLGVGDDLRNWPSQMTKLTAHRQLNSKWSVDGSLRVEWSFPGNEDYLKYANAHPINNDAVLGSPPSSNAGWDRPFGPSAFLDLGIEHKLTEHATVRLDGYNLLGWIDNSLNKRDFVASDWAGQYRAEAPALGISIRYDF